MKVLAVLFGVLLFVNFAKAENQNIIDDAGSSVPTTTEAPVTECQKYPVMSPEMPIKFDQISGTWHVIRASPCTPDDNTDAMECMSETYFKEMDSPREEMRSLMVFKNGTKKEFWTLDAHMKYYSAESTKIEPEIIFKFKHDAMPAIPCTIIGTDSGKTWLLWNCCMTFGPTPTSHWVVMSRDRFMDPKLEQTLVGYVGKTAGISPEKMLGVKQTDCN